MCFRLDPQTTQSGECQGRCASLARSLSRKGETMSHKPIAPSIAAYSDPVVAEQDWGGTKHRLASAVD